MGDYTRKQLKERWEKAKDNMSGPETVESIALHVVPGIWEVRIFPRWIFRKFLDRKIMEARHCAVMSRNITYDPDSDDTQEWGWFHWTYYFDTEEVCYVLKLDYDVDPEGIKALPLVKGILDLALVESPTSIIGKFKWRSPFLQRIPLIRRIWFIKPHRFLFYFEMEKIEGSEAALWLLSQRRTEKQMDTGIGDPRIEGKRVETIQSTTGYPARDVEDDETVITFPKDSKSWVEGYEFRSFQPYSDYGRCQKDDEKVIKFPKASESWGKVKVIAIFDPRKEGKCIAWFDIGDDETFSGNTENP